MSKKENNTNNCPCNPICPVKSALALINGKWKSQIICALDTDGTTRYNDLLKKISGITNTMLASSLKELEKDSLVVRNVSTSMPLRVEYHLSDKGKKLKPIFTSLVLWALDKPELDSAKFDVPKLENN